MPDLERGKAGEMTDAQLVAAIVVAPVTSLALAVLGYVMQNANLNARVAEIRTDLRDQLASDRAAFRELLRADRETAQAEFRAVRAEMARNHSELLHRFGDLDARLTRLEAERK